MRRTLFEGDQSPDFPHFEYPGSGYKWVDFRELSSQDWVAKAYGQ